MENAAAIVALVVGGVGFGGQALSVANWPLAQRIGLQEGDEHTDPIFLRLESCSYPTTQRR